MGCRYNLNSICEITKDYILIITEEEDMTLEKDEEILKELGRKRKKDGNDLDAVLIV